jgi:DNA (cytosine-5)-methyltransferase 1
MFVGIDLFAGAGGTTTGIEAAEVNGRKIAKVLAAINHDDYAIRSHAANHPDTIHFIEDIKVFDVKKLPELKIEPDDITFIWASLECTNFSNAKGGLPRDADSRTLAEHLFRYIEKVNPDYILIENVREFMAWGPLDKNGKPVSRDKGRDYLRWVKKVQSYGYDYSYKIINSADFGAHTSRKRLFIIFSKSHMPVIWPEITHSKDGSFGSKYRPVKECLDFSDKGESIFNRKKDLSEKTLKRIYAGLVKFIANGDTEWLLKYNSAKNNTDVNKGNTVNQPSPVISTQGRLVLVQPEFLLNYHHSSEYNDTLTQKDRLAFIQPDFFIDEQYGQSKGASIDAPAGCIIGNPKQNLVTAERFIVMQHSQGKQHESIGEPVGALLTVPKKNLVIAERAYLMNPQWGGTGHSVDDPAFTLIARMDKFPPYLVTTESGHIAIEIYESDSEYTRKIKMFMAAYDIIDIKMRMLRVHELLKIQGFPDDYILVGTQAQKKKFIGNAVVPVVAKKIFEALYEANLAEYQLKKVI